MSVPCLLYDRIALRRGKGDRMKIYLVYRCNNEAYEDFEVYVEAAFSTEEKAKDYITSCGCKPHVCVNEWEKKYRANTFDSMKNEYGDYFSMWLREMDVIG